ncbi:hypothetical protein [Streptomyces griseoruber]|uniref:Uncharacterized protein n=1 Tax=Streptomyces griseoruber TaxID=1943 RepID=A0A117REX9_9ACTN|nr:hypothetical protein [Streptomyces griseoruber]KUN87059.1 hypothetical protein AQJ64_07155 [Streptomyces griseoruber]
MRIRSVLAATVLGIALAAAGATSATADEGPRHGGHYGSEAEYGVDHEPVCSPYIGKIDTVSSDIFWGGAHCGWF